MLTTRFAPSPTGLLHLGHALAAGLAWRAARAAGGRFLLRIEDIDPGRCRPDHAAAILDDLAWLGLVWDGPVRVQSRHLAEYGAALGRLEGMGLLYPCFCTRADIRAALDAPHGPDGPVYPGTCRALDPAAAADRRARDPFALRLDMAEALRRTGRLAFHEAGEGRVDCHPARFGDVVLARRDTPASYHLCVAHDDGLQGVTLVTRGIDLRPATDVQRVLQALLGWPAPGYAHHRLLTDATGRRLAKRDHAATLRDMRARGLSPAQVRAAAGLLD